MTDILAIIPARGGSKGVPRKNIRPFAGKPLIQWTIEAAQASEQLTRIIVSTDDLEAADIARNCGVDMPFMRPAAFAQDGSTDLDVYRHAVAWLSENTDYMPDVVVWLRPTTPLRRTQDIDDAIVHFLSSDADCQRSVCKVEHHPYWMYVLKDNQLDAFVEGIDVMRDYPTRQSLPPAYRLNGAVDITRAKQVLETNKLYNGIMGAYVMPVERSMDIDTEKDFILAETLIKLEGDIDANAHQY
ncbi:MAG: acylneuraminate cytidylyltransferase family protein [Chloroflexota bacterium]